jgi:hypothetical protein
MHHLRTLLRGARSLPGAVLGSPAPVLDAWEEHLDAPWASFCVDDAPAEAAA